MYESLKNKKLIMYGDVKDMSKRKVASKEELKKAKEDKVNTIIVEGKLAKDLKATEKIKTIGPVAMATLTAFIATIPASGGVSAVAAASVAAATGMDVAAIILAASLGIGFILAIYKEYDVIEFDLEKRIMRLERH